MMEFEEEHEEEEEEEEEEDDEEMAVTPTFKPSGGGGDKKPGMAACRYRECLKNHAVGIGGHAVDGCGEFMPAGPEGSLDALKCAACNCHRNFHRKELLPPTADSHNHQLAVYSPRHPQPIHPFPPPQVYNFYPYSRTTTGPGPGPAGYLHVSTPQQQQQQQRPLALPSPSAGGAGEYERGMGTMTSSSSGKKRFRTKFTQEQKDKMLGLAERLGWRIQKQDEEVVHHFCQETGVKRHVLKVWMHNNKHTLGKKP